MIGASESGTRVEGMRRFVERRLQSVARLAVLEITALSVARKPRRLEGQEEWGVEGQGWWLLCSSLLYRVHLLFSSPCQSLCRSISGSGVLVF